MALPELTEQDRNWYILKGYEIDEGRDAANSIFWRLFKLNSLEHREDGPSFESDYGAHYAINGRKLLYSEWLEKVKALKQI